MNNTSKVSKVIHLVVAINAILTTVVVTTHILHIFFSPSAAAFTFLMLIYYSVVLLVALLIFFLGILITKNLDNLKSTFATKLSIIQISTSLLLIVFLPLFIIEFNFFRIGNAQNPPSIMAYILSILYFIVFITYITFSFKSLLKKYTRN